MVNHLHRLVAPAAIAATLLLVANSAAAQTTRTPKGFVAVGGGQQGKTPAFSEREIFTLYAEDAIAEARYGGKGGSAFDISGGFSIWRQLLVGVGFSTSSHGHAADASALLPHPFFLNASRAVDGSASGLNRKETAIHVPLMWQIRAAEKVDVVVFAGASFISASQDFVDVIEFDESYPYDTAVFTNVTLTEVSVTKTVPHVGAALWYRLTQRLSAGVQLRHASKTAGFELESGRSVNAKIGGTQFTGGIRLGF